MAKKSLKTTKDKFSLSCNDLGAKGCDFSDTAVTAEEIKKAMFEHAASAHPEVLAKMTEEQKQEMTKRMDQLLEMQK